MRTLLPLLALPLALACTFPDVDYAGAGGSTTTSSTGGAAGSDGGGDAPVDGPCQVPSKCATDASSCGKKALAEQKACKNKCKPPDVGACQMTCDTELAADLAACTTLCVSCSAAEGCPMQDATCGALVNM